MRTFAAKLAALIVILSAVMLKAQTTTIYSYSVPSGTGYDAAGNLKAYTDSTSGTWSMQYDSLNRLKNAASQSGPYNDLALEWQYDSFGNRLRQTPSGSGVANAELSMQYDSTNRITTSSIGVDSSNYDAAGNLKYDGLNSINYDAENRVCAVQNSNGTVTQYLYNPEGQRVAKGYSASGAGLVCPAPGDFVPTEKYVLGPSGEQITELRTQPNGTDVWQHTNVYVNGELLATYDQQGSQQLLHFNINDPLGTKRVQTSGYGLSELKLSSLPYGDGANTFGTGQGATEHFFTGKERDIESGLDYFGARYYASSMGRFSSPDDGRDQVAEDPQSWNLYSYVQNNPLINVDPDGHDCVTQTATSGGGETATVQTGGCSGAAGNGTMKTYIAGTVTSLSYAADGKSLNVGYNAYGSDPNTSASVSSLDRAPAPDNPGIAVGYNQSGFNQLRNTSGVVNYFGGIGMAAIGMGMETLGGTMPEIGMAGVGNTRVVFNLAHGIMDVRDGHLPPPGTIEDVRAAVTAALNEGKYSTSGNGVVNGTTTIHGVEVGFRGKMVNGVMRIATVFTKR